MVKSRKISKATVLILALSILLVLSMILGLTGAWFTKSSSADTSGATGSIKFGNIATATVTVTPTANSISGSRDAQHVLPGDTIGGATITVSLNHDVAVYATLKHVYTDANSQTQTEYYKMSGSAITKVDGGMTESTLSGFQIAAVNSAQSYTMSVAGIAIPATTQSGGQVGDYTITMGQTLQITGASGTYYLYVIQADNISAAQAVAYLQSGNHADAAAA